MDEPAQLKTRKPEQIDRDPTLARRSVSVIIPYLNERDTLETLYQNITASLAKILCNYEIIFVDDGSTDDGSSVLRKIADKDDHVQLIQFTRNFGKAAALSAGMGLSRGDVIITMDADLQDDPGEIDSFLEKIDQGYDVVSGWKQTRHDPLNKTLPSKIFNAMTARLFDIDIHDINCGFKAYTRRAISHLNLYGELHRFTPAILHAAGFRGAEIPVQHHARRFGQSKYGSKRLLKGLLDMITVKMVTRYNARPLHFFGMLGIPMLLLGGLIVAYLSVLWMLDLGPIGDRPLLLIGVLFIVTGTQLLGIGLVAELVQAVGLKEGDKYIIDRITGDTPLPALPQTDPETPEAV